MKVEKLVGLLREKGWKYRLRSGSIEITYPHGIEAEYSLSVVENAAPESILLPPCSAGWDSSRGQYPGAQHVNF